MNGPVTSLPKWAERFLRTVCPDELLEEIEGDLIQALNQKLEEAGTRSANWFLLCTVLRYLRPGIVLRNKITKPVFRMAMFRNYLLTSYRHVTKDKINSTFKLAGLTLALFSLMVVTLYVSYHLSFDRYHAGYDRIYRLNTQRAENGNIEQYGIAPAAFGEMLRSDFPELESYTRLDIANGSHLQYKGNVVYGGVFGVDSTWFTMFTHEFVSGSHQALARPGTIVLTETMAKKIFGSEDPLQKLLTINNEKTLYEVTGIIRDMPASSHLRVDAFVPINRTGQFNANHIISPPEFVDNSTVLYLKFRDGADPDRFAQRVEKALDQHVPRKQREALGFGIFLQPLQDIYLAPSLKYEFTKKGSRIYLTVFIILGVFLLVISCINYANLSLAGFMNRSREMGVRKVLGGRRSQILAQVGLDTLSYCALAFLVSVGLLYLLFPKILEYIEPNLQLAMTTTPTFIAILSLILLLLVVISTAIPAVWFTANKITNDLKGVYAGGKIKFNNTLLLVQFVISAICITATLTIGKQIDFIHTSDLGIERKNLLVLTMNEDFTTSKMIAFKASLKTIPGVTDVSNSSFRIGGGFWKDWYSVEIGNEMKSLELYEVFSDDDLFETLGMKVLKGRVFDADHKADSGAAFVINETAARLLGLDDPVGTRILTHPEDSGKWEGAIVGVVKDVNIRTLHHKIQPLVMRLPWQNQYPEIFVYVRIDGPAGTIIEAIKKQYNQLQPGYPLEVHFVDDFYNHEYASENRAYASLKFATLVILLISSLGIFSLSIYLSIRKMKEFGIRKILGASAEHITFMHVSHFVRIAGISFLVALPIAYLLMNEWLKSFAYKVNIGSGTFVIVMLSTLVLIVVSAGYAAIRAGATNPVRVINKV